MNKDISFIKQNFIAHRGVYNNVEIVENSMEAFKEAIKRKYIIELDVHLLKDNKTIVVYHDDNLERLTKINKKIVDCSYDELCKIKLFGKDIKITGKEKLSQYELAKNSNGKLVSEGNPSTLFFERDLQLLKDGGVLGIILPETYFHR